MAALKLELEMGAEGGIEGEGEADDDAGGFLKGGTLVGLRKGVGDGA